MIIKDVAEASEKYYKSIEKILLEKQIKSFKYGTSGF